jgi:flagellar biosynthesis protein FlhB
MENKPVARAMYRSVEIGKPIPLDFYEAIAEMIALIYQINESNKRKI